MLSNELQACFECLSGNTWSFNFLVGVSKLSVLSRRIFPDESIAKLMRLGYSKLRDSNWLSCARNGLVANHLTINLIEYQEFSLIRKCSSTWMRLTVLSHKQKRWGIFYALLPQWNTSSHVVDFADVEENFLNSEFISHKLGLTIICSMRKSFSFKKLNGFQNFGIYY